jgi:hypothetical protein
MVQSPSWEANSHSASQETPRHLWNPNVFCRVHKSPPEALRNICSFYSQKLLGPRQTSMLEDHPFSAAREDNIITYGKIVKT